jgi:ParB family chromosome partitioning protein
LRASILAGQATIPAFVDEAADSYDQVIENEQREGLKPLDLALFVQRRLALGESQAEIARRMGKSKQYVTYATALIDAPDWLLLAYREGRCRGMRELHELRRLHADHPQFVEDWASAHDAITRDRVETLRMSLMGGANSAAWCASAGTRSIAVTDTASLATDAKAASQPRAKSRKSSPVSRELMADLDGERVVIVADTAPAVDGQVFVRKSDSAKRIAVDAVRLTLLGFTRGLPA